jgi:hypothetical protein
MKKTFKKSDINKYMKKNKVNEFVNNNGSMISATNNYVQNRNHIKSRKTSDNNNGSMISATNNYVQNRSHIKSRKTSDDFVRNSTQGPEAYFIYGGPYYGVNYSYVVNEYDDR